MPSEADYRAAEKAVRNGSATPYQERLNDSMANTDSGRSARDAQVNFGLNKDYGQGPNQHPLNKP